MVHVRGFLVGPELLLTKKKNIYVFFFFFPYLSIGASGELG
jgi:hypothetical protein